MKTLLHNWKIYLDTCCLSRLDDIATSVRIQREAEAVETIIDYCSTRQWLWFGSAVLTFEVNNTQNRHKREQIQSHLSYVYQNVIINLAETSKAKYFESLGFKQADALHLACAESGDVDVFLTTDDGILKRAKRFGSQLQVRVENPYEWLQEMTKDENPEKKNRQ